MAHMLVSGLSWLFLKTESAKLVRKKSKNSSYFFFSTLQPHGFWNIIITHVLQLTMEDFDFWCQSCNCFPSSDIPCIVWRIKKNISYPTSFHTLSLVKKKPNTTAKLRSWIWFQDWLTSLNQSRLQKKKVSVWIRQLY